MQAVGGILVSYFWRSDPYRRSIIATTMILYHSHVVAPMALLLAARYLLMLGVVQSEVVEYDWHVRPRRSVVPHSPDCYTNRDMLLINDINPGPVLRAKVGDTVRVTIRNHSPTEALSIHYHGISMWQQPYSDGVQTASQCNIGPLQTQVNEFQIHKRDAGLHYWHGHTSLDRQDGLQGAIIIEDPDDPDEIALKAEYDEERIIMLQDWYHRPGPSNRIGLDSEPFIWLGNAQSFLINGKAAFAGCLDGTTTENCAEGCSLVNYTSSIDVEAGKTYLFRILNVASLVPVNFAIANHTMTIVSAEGTYIEPRLDVTDLDVGVAQRYSVLLTADQDDGQSYWMETIVRFRGDGVNGLAYLSYDGSPIPDENGPFPEHPEFDDVPSWAELDALLTTKNPERYDEATVLSVSEPDHRFIIVGTQLRQPETNNLKWAANNITQTFPAVPLIYSAYQAAKAEGALSWPDTVVESFVEVPKTSPVTWDYTVKLQDSGVSIFNKETGPSVVKLVANQTIEIVLQNALALNGVAEFHSWHMHGHSFWVVGYGQGTFDPETDPASFNLVNPIRRDTLSLHPLGWTAIRFIADSPGAWPFHCSMTPHAVMGMGFTLITSPDLLPPPPPGVTSCFRLSLDLDDAEVCTSDGVSLRGDDDDDDDDNGGGGGGDDDDNGPSAAFALPKPCLLFYIAVLSNVLVFVVL